MRWPGSLALLDFVDQFAGWPETRPLPERGGAAVTPRLRGLFWRRGNLVYRPALWKSLPRLRPGACQPFVKVRWYSKARGYRGEWPMLGLPILSRLGHGRYPASGCPTKRWLRGSPAWR